MVPAHTMNVSHIGQMREPFSELERGSETEGFDFASYLLGLQISTPDLPDNLTPNPENSAITADLLAAEATQGSEGIPTELISESKPSLAGETERVLVSLFTGEGESVSDQEVRPTSQLFSKAQVASSAPKGESMTSEQILNSFTHEKLRADSQNNQTGMVDESATYSEQVTGNSTQVEESDLEFGVERRLGIRRYANNALGEKETIRMGRSAEMLNSQFGVNEIGLDTNRTEIDFSSAMDPVTSDASTGEVPAPVQELFDHVQSLVNRGGGKMSVKLNPPHLGQMEIEVFTRGSNVEVDMTSESESAKSLLESQFSELKRSLESQDLVASRLEVNVGTHDFANSQSEFGEDTPNDPNNPSNSRTAGLISQARPQPLVSQHNVLRNTYGNGRVDIQI